MRATRVVVVVAVVLDGAIREPLPLPLEGPLRLRSLPPTSEAVPLAVTVLHPPSVRTVTHSRYHSHHHHHHHHHQYNHHYTQHHSRPPHPSLCSGPWIAPGTSRWRRTTPRCACSSSTPCSRAWPSRRPRRSSRYTLRLRTVCSSETKNCREDSNDSTSYYPLVDSSLTFRPRTVCSSEGKAHPVAQMEWARVDAWVVFDGCGSRRVHGGGSWVSVMP